MHPYLVPGIVAGVGVVIIILSCVLGFVVVPNIIDNKIEEEVRLIEGGETWDKWKEIPIPVYLNFYMLNVTNPDEFEAGIELPKFNETGPYSYRQTRVKVNIRQEDGQDTVNFEEVKTYFFDESTSCKGCREDDEYNIINVPYMAVLSGLFERLGPVLMAGIANNLYPNQTVIRRDVKVGELTFSGFNVSVFTALLDAVGEVPVEFEGGKFALYKTTNVSSDGEYKIYTGVGNSADFGKIITWNGSDTVPDEWWRVGSPCAMINGTDGSVFPPFVEKSRRLDIFVTDLCRSLYLLYDSEVEHLGIKGYRFVAPKAMLEDPRINLDNMCFCMKDSVEDCPNGGVLDVSTCRSGAPIAMSTPHFLDGDDRYVRESGMTPPIREEHFTFIDLEVHTGVTLRASKKIQVNINVKKYHGVNAMKNLASEFMVFPLIWADETATLDEESADDLKKQLLTPLKIVNISKWVVLAVGCLLTGLGIGIFIMRYRRGSETV